MNPTSFLLALLLAQSPSAPPQTGSAPEIQGPPSPASTTPPQPAPAEDPDPNGPVLDEVVQIVNEDMLTRRTFLSAMYMQNDWKRFKDADDVRRNEQKVHENSVKYALRVQAGQDMGLDPAQVDRQAKSWIDGERERRGPDDFAAMLRHRSMTLFEFQEWVRDQFYARFWENYITGTGSIGQGSRQSRDRFVRPGYVFFRYHTILDHRELLTEIGGQDQRVIVQQLIIDPTKSPGGLDAARTLAEDLRGRILGGEDMSNLVDLYGALKVNHGISDPPYFESRLMKGDPVLGAFVADSKPGDLSEVLESKMKDHVFWRVIRLVDRLPEVVPDVSSVEVQKKLEEGVRTYLADWRLDQAIKVLYRTSYVWSPGDEQR